MGTRHTTSFPFFLMATTALSFFGSLTAHAQIVVDGRTETTLTDTGPNTITVTTESISQGNAINAFSIFNVNAGQTVNLVQPDATNSLINIVTGDQGSLIEGTLNAIKNGEIGGNVIIANTNGIVIGRTGTVNAGHLTLTTPSRAFTDSLFGAEGAFNDAAFGDLVAGREVFDPDADIRVLEGGQINANALAVRAGRDIQIAGRVYSRFGGMSFNLADGERPDIKQAEELVIDEDGVVHLLAGRDVSLTGEVASLGTNTDGSANGGEINIVAGRDIEVAGRVDVSAIGDGDAGTALIYAGRDAIISSEGLITAAAEAGRGGFVEFSAAETVIQAGRLEAHSVSGDSGAILIDPVNVVITNSVNTLGADLTYEASGSVTLEDSVTISTRNVGLVVPAVAPEDIDAVSLGDSGNLTILATEIDIGSDARLLTHGIDANAGNITLLAGGLTNNVLVGGQTVSYTLDSDNNVTLADPDVKLTIGPRTIIRATATGLDPDNNNDPFSAGSVSLRAIVRQFSAFDFLNVLDGASATILIDNADIQAGDIVIEALALSATEADPDAPTLAEIVEEAVRDAIDDLVPDMPTNSGTLPSGEMVTFSGAGFSLPDFSAPSFSVPGFTAPDLPDLSLPNIGDLFASAPGALLDVLQLEARAEVTIIGSTLETSGVIDTSAMGDGSAQSVGAISVSSDARAQLTQFGVFENVDNIRLGLTNTTSVVSLSGTELTSQGALSVTSTVEETQHITLESEADSKAPSVILSVRNVSNTLDIDQDTTLSAGEDVLVRAETLKDIILENTITTPMGADPVSTAAAINVSFGRNTTQVNLAGDIETTGGALEVSAGTNYLHFVSETKTVIDGQGSSVLEDVAGFGSAVVFGLTEGLYGAQEESNTNTAAALNFSYETDTTDVNVDAPMGAAPSFMAAGNVTVSASLAFMADQSGVRAPISISSNATVTEDAGATTTNLISGSITAFRGRTNVDIGNAALESTAGSVIVNADVTTAALGADQFTTLTLASGEGENNRVLQGAFFQFRNDAGAIVGSGADIDATVGSIIVSASIDQDMRHQAGAPDDSDAGAIFALSTPLDLLFGGGTKGGAFTLNRSVSRVEAAVLDGADLNAQTLTVDAQNTGTIRALANAGNGVGTSALIGVLGLSVVDNDTIARVEAGARITAIGTDPGDIDALSITATDNLALTSFGDGAATGTTGATVVGGGVNLIDRTTLASLGSQDVPPGDDVLIRVAGLAIEAKNIGAIRAASVAGTASLSNFPTFGGTGALPIANAVFFMDADGTTQAIRNAISPPAGAMSGVSFTRSLSLSGNTSLNIANTRASADIFGDGLIEVSAGGLALTAVNDFDVSTTGLTRAIGGFSNAVGGSLIGYEDDVTTTASINGVDIGSPAARSGAVSVSAIEDVDAATTTSSFGGTVSGTGVTLTGAAVLFDSEARAVALDADFETNEAVNFTVAGDSDFDTRSLTLAGTVVGVTASGAVAVNLVGADSRILLSNVDLDTAGADINLSLDQTGDISSQAVAGAVGGGTAAGAGVTVNQISGDNYVDILSSDIMNAGAVVATARDGRAINSFTGGAAAGATAGGGAASSTNFIGVNFGTSLIDTNVEADALALRALNSSVINSRALALGGSGSFSGSASVSYNQINNSVSSFLDGGVLTIGGLIEVAADKSTRITSDANSVAISGGVGASGAVALNFIADTVVADVRVDDLVTSNGLEVRADNASVIDTAAIAGAGGGVGAGAGAVAYSQIGDGDAARGGLVLLDEDDPALSDEERAQRVRENEERRRRATQVSSTVNSANGVQRGRLGDQPSDGMPLPDIPIIASRTARLNTPGDTVLASLALQEQDQGLAIPVDLQTLSLEEVQDLRTQTNFAPILLSFTELDALSNEARAAYETNLTAFLALPFAETTLTIDAIDVLATDRSSIQSDTGAVAGGGTAGIGASASVNDYDGQVEAVLSVLGANNLITGRSAPSAVINVIADGQADIGSRSAAGAVGGTAALAGATSINFLNGSAIARITGGASNADALELMGGSLSVISRQNGSVDSFSGAASGGGSAGLAGAVGYNELGNNATATISRLSLNAGDTNLLITSSSRGDTDLIAASVGIGGIGFAGSAGVTEQTGSTVAGVSDAIINTSGNIGFAAENTLNTDVFSGALAGGVGAFGGGVSLNTISGNVTVFGQSSTLSGADISFQALNTTALDTDTIAAALGSAAFSGAVAVNTLNNTVSADLGIASDVAIASTGTVTIGADQVAASDARQGALAGGGLAAGIAIAIVNNSGTAQTRIGSASPGDVVSILARDIDISTSDTSELIADGSVLAGGFIGSGAAAIIDSTNRSSVSTVIGSGVELGALGGNINVISGSQSHSSATTRAAAFSGGVAAGFSQAEARNVATVSTSLLDGADLTSTGQISIGASLASLADQDTVEATATSAAGGVGAAGGARANAINSFTLSTLIGDVDIIGAGGVSLTSDAVSSADADVTGVVFGGVALGGVSAFAGQDTGDATNAVVRVSDGAFISAAEGLFAINASVRDRQTADATSGAGGIVTGSGSLASTNAIGAAQVIFDDGNSRATATRILADGVDIGSSFNVEISARIDNFSAGLVGLSGALSDTSSISTSRIDIGDNIQIASTDAFDILATNTVEQLDVGNNVQSSSVGLATLPAVEANSAHTLNTSIDIGDGTQLDQVIPLLPGETRDDFSAFNIGIETNLTGFLRAVLDTGGLISLPQADIGAATTVTSAINIGAADLFSSSDLNIYNLNTAEYIAALRSTSFGLAGAARGDSSILFQASETIDIAAGAELESLRDIYINVSGSRDRVSGIRINADTRLFNRTLFSFSNPNVSARVDVDRILTIGDDDAASVLPQIVAVRNVDLIAEDTGTSAIGNGLGTSALLEALRDAACALIPGDCFIPSTTVRITNQGNNALAQLHLNADIVAGDRAIQTLIIRDFADAEEGSFNIGDPTGRLVLDENGVNIAPNTIISNDDNAQIRSGDVVEQSDGLSFQFENGVGLLAIAQERIDNLQAQRDATQARLDADRSVLSASQIASLEILIDGLDAELVSRRMALSDISAADQTTIIRLNDIIVDEGSINISAASLNAGRGSLTANGNAQVNVEIDAPFILVAGNITVGREEGGFIRYNDVLVNSSAELAALGGASLDAGFEVTSAPGDNEPLIRLTNQRVFGPDTTDISLAGNIVNFRGALEVATGLGNIDITGRNNAENVRLEAPRGAITQSPITGLVNTGGAPQFQFRDGVGGIADFAQQRLNNLAFATGLLSLLNASSNGAPLAGNLQDDDNSNRARSNLEPGSISGISASGINSGFELRSNISPTSQSVISAAESVFIAAEIININGRIEAGLNTFDLEIGAGATAEIAALLARPNPTGGNFQTVYNVTTGAGGNLGSIDPSSNVNVILDRARGVLIIEPLLTRPGRIEIFGNVISTGNGELFARDGFGRVNIANASDIDLEFTSISTGDNAGDLAGTIIITDALRNRGIVDQVNGQSVASIGTQFVYRRVGSDIQLTTRVIDALGRSLSTIPDVVQVFSGPVNFDPIQGRSIQTVIDRQFTLRQSDRLVEFQANNGAPIDFVFERDFTLFADPLLIPAMPTFTVIDSPNASRLTVSAGSLGFGSFLLPGSAAGLENAEQNFSFGAFDTSGNLLTRGFVFGRDGAGAPRSGINLPVIGQNAGQVTFVSNSELQRGNLSDGGRSLASLFVTDRTFNDPLTITIRADLPVSVGFEGNDTPELNIISTGLGQVLFTESVLNRGAAAVIANGDILTSNDDVRLAATDITLISNQGRIGGLDEETGVFTVSQIGDASSEFNALAFGSISVRDLGNVDGQPSDGSFNIGQVESLTGDVFLRGRGDLIGSDTFTRDATNFLDLDGNGTQDLAFNLTSFTAPISAANVRGESITLISDSGSIGAIGAGQADSSAAGTGYVAGTDPLAVLLGQSDLAQLNATANNDIAIVQADGDLFVENISAGSGSVFLDIENGQLLDRDDVTLPDVLARTALLDLFSELGLLEPDDPNAINPVEERVNRQRRTLITSRELQFREYIRTGGDTSDPGRGDVNINQDINGEVLNLLRDVGPGFDNNSDIGLAVEIRADLAAQASQLTFVDAQVADLANQIAMTNAAIAAGPTPDVLTVLQNQLSAQMEALAFVQAQQSALTTDQTNREAALAAVEARLSVDEQGAVVSIVDLLATIDQAAELRADGSPAALMALVAVEADIAAALLTADELEELTFETSDAAFRLEELQFGINQAFIDILLDPLRTGILPPDTEFDIENANILARNGDIIVNQASGVGSFDEGIALDLSLVSVDFDSETMPGTTNTSDTIAFNRNIFDQSIGAGTPGVSPEDIFFALLGASRNDLSINLSTQLVENGGITETISQAGLTVRRAEDIDIAAGGRIIFNSRANVTGDLDGDLFVGSEEDITLGAINTDGETRISTSGDIFDAAIQPVAIDAGGNVELEAAGGQIGTETRAINVSLANDATIGANSGSIYLTTPGDIALGIISGTERVSILADGDILDGFTGADADTVNILGDELTLRAEGRIGTADNALELRQLQDSTLAGLLALSAGQTINVVVEDDARLGLIESRNLVGLGDIDLTLNGDAVLGTISTLDDVIIRSPGNLTDGTSGTSIIADELILQARNVGLISNALNTSVNRLTLSGTVPGSVFNLANRQDVVLDASALSGLMLGVDGDLVVDRATIGRDLILRDISGNLLSGILEADTIEIGAGGIGGASAIILDAETISLETTGTARAGDVNVILADGETEIDTVDLQGAGARLTLTGSAADLTLARSGGGIMTNNGDVSLSARNVSLYDAVDLGTGTLSVRAIESGVFGTGSTVSAGNINLTAGNDLILNGLIASADGDISLAARNAIFGGSVRLGSGDGRIDISDAVRFDMDSLLRSESGALIVNTNTINAAGVLSTGSGSISIETMGAAVLGATSQIQSDSGDIALNIGVLSGGLLSQVDLAEIEARAGSVSIETGGDFQAASVHAGGALSLLVAGTLRDNGLGAPALSSNDTVNLRANALGTQPGQGLTLSAERLIADIAQGDVHLNVLGDISLDNVIAGDGLLDVFSTGTLSVGELSSINLADSNLSRIVLGATGSILGDNASLNAQNISLVSINGDIGRSALNPFNGDTSPNTLLDLVAAGSIFYTETAGDLAVNFAAANAGDLVLSVQDGGLTANGLGAANTLSLTVNDGVQIAQIGGNVQFTLLGNPDLALINQPLYGQRILRTSSGLALASPGSLVIQNIDVRDRLELEATSIDIGVTDTTPGNGLILLVRGPSGTPVSTANVNVQTGGALAIEQLIVTDGEITTTGNELVLQDGTIGGRVTFQQGDTDILVTNPDVFQGLSDAVDIEGQTGPQGEVSFALANERDLAFSPVLLNHRNGILLESERAAFFAAATEIAGVFTSARNDMSVNVIIEVIEGGRVIDRIPLAAPNRMNAAGVLLSMFRQGALQAFLNARYGRPVDFVLVTADGTVVQPEAVDETPIP